MVQDQLFTQTSSNTGTFESFGSPLQNENRKNNIRSESPPTTKPSDSDLYNSANASPLLQRPENNLDPNYFAKPMLSKILESSSKEKQRSKDPFLRRIYEYRGIYEEFMNKNNSSMTKKDIETQYSRKLDSLNPKLRLERSIVDESASPVRKNPSPERELTWTETNEQKVEPNSKRVQVTEQEEEEILSREDLNMSYKKMDAKLKLKDYLQEKRPRGESPLLRSRNLVPSLTPSVITQRNQDPNSQLEKPERLTISNPIVKVQKEFKVNRFNMMNKLRIYSQLNSSYVVNTSIDGSTISDNRSQSAMK